MKSQPQSQPQPQPTGITTRRKEHQSSLSSSKKPQDPSNSYPTLKHFDDFYKEAKNLQNETYVHRSPKIDKEKCQVDLSLITPQKEKCIPIEQKYVLDKLPPEDFDYYMKFIEYYDQQIGNDNIYLRGVHSVQAKALDLLKQCNYDINTAMAKILFPVMDQMNWLGYSLKNKALYISSALNDLIGANNKEKKEWLSYIDDSLKKKININDLQVLIEKGTKMKIEIPPCVQRELSRAVQFSKVITQELANKNNSLNAINNLYEISQTFQVQTEEFSNVGDLLKKASCWEKKVKNINNQCVSIKTLQTLYNEGKNLPFKFEGDEFDSLKKRYEGATNWHYIYSNLPRHSKTRQQGASRQTERSSLEDLKSMITTADKVNFTSNEVETLKKNYELLSQAEKKIKEQLNDDKIEKTKELLQEFLNTLDNLRFTTELYDVVEQNLALKEWQEKKEQFINSSINNNGNNSYIGSNGNNNCNNSSSSNIVKLKHFRNLIKFAEQKNLRKIEEIETFKSMYNEIDEWIKTMSHIFEPSSSSYGGSNNSNNNIINNNNNDNHNNNNTTSQLNPLLTSNLQDKPIYEILEPYYQKGKQFKYKPEECEILLLKCEEFFDFIQKCKDAYNTHNTKDDYDNLCLINKEIQQYNIECKEFKQIEQQITQVETWLHHTKHFITNYNDISSSKKTTITAEQLLNLNKRSNNINILDTYLQNNTIYYETLVQLYETAPIFARNLPEYTQLHLLKTEAESIMKDEYKYMDSLDNIVKYIKHCQGYCVSEEFLKKIISLYRIKSWMVIANLNNKMTLYDAEVLLKEASGLNVNNNEVDILKRKVHRTKEWIKSKKKFMLANVRSFGDLEMTIEEGKELPLETDEVNELVELKVSVDCYVKCIREMFESRKHYDDIKELVKKVKDIKICDVEDFNMFITFANICEIWVNIAQRILTSRQLCKLYFKTKKNGSSNAFEGRNEDIAVDEGNGMQLQSQQICQENNMEQHYSECNNNNNNKTHNENGLSTFLGIKRKSDNNLLHLQNTINDSNKVNIALQQSFQFKSNNNIDNGNNNNNNIDNNNNNNTTTNIDNDIHMNIYNDNNNNDDMNQPETFNNNNDNSSYNDNSIDDDILSPYQSSHLSRSECIALALLSTEKADKPTIERFYNMSFEKRYEYLLKRDQLREDSRKQYCICRKGNDNINNMVQCEACKGWFHFTCINFPDSEIETIKDYICIACARRKDEYKLSYHSSFYEDKRYSNDDLQEFINEGSKLNAIFDELEALKVVKAKTDKWLIRYNDLLQKVIEHYNKGALFLNEELDRDMLNLYLESEGFCVEVKHQYNVIMILKQSDWLEEAVKYLEQEDKKNFIKNISKVLNNASALFNKDNKDFINGFNAYTDIESEYMDMIIQKGINMVIQLGKVFQKNTVVPTITTTITTTNNNININNNTTITTIKNNINTINSNTNINGNTISHGL